MEAADAAAVRFDRDEPPQGFGQIDPALWSNNETHFGENFVSVEGEVHVVVVVPKRVEEDDVWSAEDLSTVDLQVNSPMRVDVFGLPGALQDQDFDHTSTVTPSFQLNSPAGTGTKWLSSLSAPGLSRSAIVCTKRGVSYQWDILVVDLMA
ncbi:unnamed protein product [Phytophthora fragariaefolia]|uniref:Unnamed protein product n=1 Tax=Phytophthora fragariaefolia TaxID=1490495 RepID=A0A9W6X837_9STRA|nr:unnamed protein product [Phytophthora fragariaefolia]